MATPPIINRGRHVSVPDLFRRFADLIEDEDNHEQIKILDPGYERLTDIARIVRAYSKKMLGRDII